MSSKTVPFDQRLSQEATTCLQELLKKYPEVRNMILLVDYAPQLQGAQLPTCFIELSPHYQVKASLNTVNQRMLDLHRLCLNTGSTLLVGRIEELVGHVVELSKQKNAQSTEDH